MTDGYQIFEWLSGIKMDEENEDHEEEQTDIYLQWFPAYIVHKLGSALDCLKAMILRFSYKDSWNMEMLVIKPYKALTMISIIPSRYSPN